MPSEVVEEGAVGVLQFAAGLDGLDEGLPPCLETVSASGMDSVG